MTLGPATRFVVNATLAGLAGAAVLLIFFPQWLEPGSVVEIREVREVRSPSGNTASTGPAAGEGPVSYADAVARAAPAVVNIFAERQITQASDSLLSDSFFRRYFGESLRERQPRAESNLGSGVILSSQGYLLTNNHLVEGAVRIQALLQDGRATDARVVGTDPDTDLAVLKIDLPELPTVGVRGADPLRVGDVVLAIGNPFGVGQTVTMGIVSATGRSHLGVSTFEDFIQTDAAINPGNSGGALIDAHGRLIGINTAIFAGGSEGIGFAIPVHMARTVMEAIVEHGYVARGWLGAAVLPVGPQASSPTGLRQEGGVLVDIVTPGSPAERGGLNVGDVITHIDGEPVPTPQAATNAVAATKPGENITIALLRDGELITITAAVGERPRAPSRP